MKMLSVKTLFVFLFSVLCISSQLSAEEFKTSVMGKHLSEIYSLHDQVQNRFSLTKLIIVYDDLHGFWGGTRITVLGSSGYTEKIQKEVGNKPAKVLSKTISDKELYDLIKLLIEIESWEQKIPERTPLPDESRTYLHISTTQTSSSVWEWTNDEKKNERLIKIREMLDGLV